MGVEGGLGPSSHVINTLPIKQYPLSSASSYYSLTMGKEANLRTLLQNCPFYCQHRQCLDFTRMVIKVNIRVFPGSRVVHEGAVGEQLGWHCSSTNMSDVRGTGLIIGHLSLNFLCQIWVLVVFFFNSVIGSDNSETWGKLWWEIWDMMENIM